MKADGDVIVWDSGSAPYVTANGGVIPIETGVSAVDDVEGLIAELLPAEQRALLERLGALSVPASPLSLVARRAIDSGCRSVGRELVGRIGRTRTLRRAEAPTVLTMEDSRYAGAERRDSLSAKQRHGVVPPAMAVSRFGIPVTCMRHL